MKKVIEGTKEFNGKWKIFFSKGLKEFWKGLEDFRKEGFDIARILFLDTQDACAVRTRLFFFDER